MMSFKSLQVPAKPSPLSLETILEWHHWSKRNCALLGQVVHGDKGGLEQLSELPEVTAPEHMQGLFWFAFLPISVSGVRGSPARPFHGSCAGGMCLLLAPFPLGWAGAAPGRSCFGTRPKPQEFLFRLQVSTNLWTDFMEKGQNHCWWRRQHMEGQNCSFGILLKPFPLSRQALWLITWTQGSSAETTVTGKAEVRQSPSISWKNIDIPDYEPCLNSRTPTTYIAGKVVAF